MLDEDYFLSLTAKLKEEANIRRNTSWKGGLALFSNMSQLRKLYSTAPSDEWASCALDELSDLTDNEMVIQSDLTDID